MKQKEGAVLLMEKCEGREEFGCTQMPVGHACTPTQIHVSETFRMPGSTGAWKERNKDLSGISLRRSPNGFVLLKIESSAGSYIFNHREFGKSHLSFSETERNLIREDTNEEAFIANYRRVPFQISKISTGSSI
jgi:hypothetical protein